MDLPDIRQRENHDCGDTAFRIVCESHGWRARAALSNPIDGTDPRTLEHGFRRLGKRVTSGEMTLADLRHFTRRGCPVIALVQLDGVGHYVVVGQSTSRFVAFQCPSNGPRSLSAAKFLRLWTDIDRSGTIYHQWGIAAWE